MTPKILVFAGSIRTGAYSGKTADAAARALAAQGAVVTRLSLGDYALPIMDQNLEAESGVPENAVRLARQFVDHDGLLIATPEYNGSMPPLLKNAIDWVSRVKMDRGEPMRPFPGKVVALCSSSEGHFAGIRAIGHLRAVLSQLQMEVISPQVSVPYGEKAFDENGDFHEERLRNGMERLSRTLIERAAMLSTRMER